MTSYTDSSSYFAEFQKSISAPDPVRTITEGLIGDETRISWIGNPRCLEDLVLVPWHSVIEQSGNTLVCGTPVIAGGFGHAWYENRAAELPN